MFVCVEGWYQCNLLALTTLLPRPQRAPSRQAMDTHWGRRLQGRGAVGVGPHNPQATTPRFVRVQVGTRMWHACDIVYPCWSSCFLISWCCFLRVWHLVWCKHSPIYLRCHLPTLSPTLPPTYTVFFPCPPQRPLLIVFPQRPLMVVSPQRPLLVVSPHGLLVFTDQRCCIFTTAHLPSTRTTTSQWQWLPTCSRHTPATTPPLALPAVWCMIGGTTVGPCWAGESCRTTLLQVSKYHWACVMLSGR